MVPSGSDGSARSALCAAAVMRQGVCMGSRSHEKVDAAYAFAVNRSVLKGQRVGLCIVAGSSLTSGHRRRDKRVRTKDAQRDCVLSGHRCGREQRHANTDAASLIPLLLICTISLRGGSVTEVINW